MGECDYNGDLPPMQGDPCPGWYARWEAAREAERARRWWERGQLDVLYPGGITAPVIAAVEAADEEHRAWRAEGERRIRQQQEDAAKNGR